MYKGHATQVPLLQEGTSMQSPMPKSDDSTLEKGKGKKVLTQDTSSTETSPPPNPTPTTSTTQPHHPQLRQWTTPCSHNMTTSSVTRWIPKRLLQAQGKPRRHQAKRAHHQKKMHQRWVPVPILKGQGFYQGNEIGRAHV